MNTKIMTHPKVLSSLGIITIVSILLLCLNTFYWADDYNFMFSLNQNGIIQNSIDGYQNWDGRMMSLTAFVQFFLLKNFQIEFVTFFWSVCFLTSGVVFFKIVQSELKFKIKGLYKKILIVSLLVIVVWLGGIVHFAQTIYWGTGGFYSFASLLGALWILLFLKFQTAKFSVLQKILFLIFSMIVGGTSQNLSLGMLTLIIIYIIHNELTRKRPVLKMNIFILIFTLAGLIFIVSAPGNFERMKAAGIDNFSEITVFNLFENFVFGLIRYVYYSILAIIFSIVSAYIIFRLLNPNVVFYQFPKFNFPKTKENISQFLLNSKWLLMALSTIIPFCVMPNLISKRTVNFFVFFVMLFTFSVSYKFFNKVFRKPNQNHEKSISTKAIFLYLIMIMGTLAFTIFNFTKGNILKQKITVRENLLKNSNGKTVHLKRIDQNLTSPCYEFSDFPSEESNSENFIKSGHEQYFNVKIVIED